ncbi:MAG TPA: 16S rRNA (cytosine(1402)-N(4))-methyltransferase RsmH [Bacteroidales bacterium]|nr:16S rRNA (cytosine(1402)-N(4))-methyltransferase RsmH [Bacteroidales bacterium]
MYHKSVLLHEATQGLNVRPGGIYADLTYGGGGHTAAILQGVGNGTVIAFDQDEDALKNRIDDERLILIHANFRHMRNFLKLYKAVPLDGILADLGISSFQIDERNRGFSTRYDAALDLRMNRATRLTASHILNQYPEQQIRIILKEYGEVPGANLLAAKICDVRVNTPIETTGQLMEIVKSVAPKNRENKIGAQVFQALRIEVNDELGALKAMLDQTVEVLRPGGRLVVISYHSLEDRMVKNFLRTGNTEGNLEKDFYGNPKLVFKQITRKPLMPVESEIMENSRARSARLRIGERLPYEPNEE